MKVAGGLWSKYNPGIYCEYNTFCGLLGMGCERTRSVNVLCTHRSTHSPHLTETVEVKVHICSGRWAESLHLKYTLPMEVLLTCGSLHLRFMLKNKNKNTEFFEFLCVLGVRYR